MAMSPFLDIASVTASYPVGILITPGLVHVAMLVLILWDSVSAKVTSATAVVGRFFK